MDVWLTYCRKTIPSCSYCHEPIDLGSLMVCGKLWQRSSEEGGETRRWLQNFRWHGKRIRDNQNCWMEQQMIRLTGSPIIETRGRRKLPLSDEMREERLKVLRTRARLVAKLRELMLAPLDQKDTDQIIRIGSRIEGMKEKMAELGGVPRSWE